MEKERIVKPVRRPGHMPELKSRLRFRPACKSLLSSIGFSARKPRFCFFNLWQSAVAFCTSRASFGRLRGLCLLCGRNPCRARTARASRPRAPLTAALLSWTQAISRKRGKPVFFEGGVSPSVRPSTAALAVHIAVGFPGAPAHGNACTVFQAVAGQCLGQTRSKPGQGAAEGA